MSILSLSVSQTNDTSRISIYLRIARILRDRIQKGDWPVGHALPTLSELGDEFSVSRNTIRQALQLLVSNGLIHNARGRPSIVKAIPVTPETNARIIQAINDPFVSAPLTSIEILARETVKEPPLPLIQDGRLYPSYVRLLKIHRLEDQPYALADFYIAGAVAQSFPGGSEELFKVERLLREQRTAQLASKQQSIIIGYADAETAQALQCEMAEVIVQVRRWWKDVEDCIVCTSQSHYLADHFVFEVAERFDYPGKHGHTAPPPTDAG